MNGGAPTATPAALRVALLLAIGLFAFNSRHAVASGLLLVLWLVALTPLRVAPDRVLQLALGLVGVGFAWLVSLTAGATADTRMVEVLGPIGQFVSLGLLLLSVGRLFFAAPWGGVRASAALGLLTLLFLADGQFGVHFVATSLVVLLCLWRALWASEPARTGWRAMDGALRLRVALTGALAAAVAVGAMVALPAAYPWLARVVLAVLDDGPRSTGFGTTLVLGALSDLGDDDSRVLRVHGARVDHLRGMAYDAYARGRWLRSADSRLQPARLARPRARALAGTTQIETVGGDTARYFLPLEATAIGVEAGTARVDRAGNLYPVAPAQAERVAFRSGARERLLPEPPTPQDLAIPDALVPELRRLAERWTAGVAGNAPRVAALAAQLRSRYTYSLAFERSRGIDPVLDFLTVHREGHCEYFASALALLARSLGIPARVIGGYRVVEHNELGGYYLVRERHAHAWVEAWQPGAGWQTHDATPASGRPEADQRSGWLSSALDYAGHLGASAVRSLTARHLYLGAALLFVAWMLLRIVRAFNARSARPAGAIEAAPSSPELARLLRALERHGHPRVAQEPLERYAARLGDTPALRTSAAALHRYAAHRYGGHGSVVQLRAELARARASLGPGGA